MYYCTNFGAGKQPPSLGLPVRRPRAVLAEVVLVAQGVGDRLRVGVDGESFQRHGREFFHDHGIVRRVRRVLPQQKGAWPATSTAGQRAARGPAIRRTMATPVLAS